MRDFYQRLAKLLDGLAAGGCDEASELLEELRRRIYVAEAKKARLRELDQMDAHGEKPSGLAQH